MSDLLHWLIGVLPLGLTILATSICFISGIFVTWSIFADQSYKFEHGGNSSEYCEEVFKQWIGTFLISFVITIILLIFTSWFTMYWFYGG